MEGADYRQFHRRTILRTTAVGGGLALGAGSGSAAGGSGPAGAQEADVLTTAEATISDVAITVDADDPTTGSIVFSDEGVPEAVTLSFEIYEDGSWAATDVSVPDGAELLDELDIAGFVEGFNLPLLIDSLTLDGLAEFLVSVVDSMDLDQTQIDAVVDLADSLIDVMGVDFGSYDVQTLLDELEDFLAAPDTDTVHTLIDLAGVVFGESIDTMDDVFDLLGIDGGQDVEDILTSIDVADSAAMERVSIDIEPANVTGQYDPNGVTTVEPDSVQVGISLVGADLLDQAFPKGDPEPPADIALTSGLSGGLHGSAVGVVSDAPEFVLVDNRFVVGWEAVDLHAWLANKNLEGLFVEVALGVMDELNVDPETDTVDDLIDIVMAALEDIGLDGLLNETALSARIQDVIETLDIDTEGVMLQDIIDAVHIEQVLTDLDLAAILASMDVEGTINGFFSDESGRHAIQMSVDVSVDDPQVLADELVEVPPLIEGADPPRDTTGTGLLYRVRGEDEFTIHDVQLLFDSLDSETIQAHAEYFNFQGLDPDEVTIFDVQSHFLALQNGDV